MQTRAGRPFTSPFRPLHLLHPLHRLHRLLGNKASESGVYDMITVKPGDGSPLTFGTIVQGFAIYLDNFAIKELAKGDPSRRQRFVNSVHKGADLLFSVANAAELCGPTGRSFDMIKEFLNELGEHWFPVELDPLEAVKRELSGESVAGSCVSKNFMKDYFKIRLMDYSPGSGQVINLYDQFFRLGPVMDWVASQRKSIQSGQADLDEALINQINRHRQKYDRDQEWLDASFPNLPFKPSHPATFTYSHLIRTLIVEAKSHQLKKGDGTDFCHAIMAGAYASVGTLDKHWKRRIESLPKPNQLATIYYEPELDEMVDEIEKAVAILRS
jgi:hypothetical protein